jgi:hypothetical protein
VEVFHTKNLFERRNDFLTVFDIASEDADVPDEAPGLWAHKVNRANVTAHLGDGVGDTSQHSHLVGEFEPDNDAVAGTVG